MSELEYEATRLAQWDDERRAQWEEYNTTGSGADLPDYSCRMCGEYGDSLSEGCAGPRGCGDRCRDCYDGPCDRCLESR